MGSGKTHAVPEIINPWGGRIWYLSRDHRNPSVEKIKDKFEDLAPRNKNGFYEDTDGKLKPAKEHRPDTITHGKCIRADLFSSLTELGHDPNEDGGNNPICRTCPMSRTCRFTPGWYRHDRKEALSARYIRADIRSLPRDFDYSKDIAILEEPTSSLPPPRRFKPHGKIYSKKLTAFGSS